MKGCFGRGHPGAVFRLSLWTPEIASSVHLTINAPYRCVQALKRGASLFSSISFLKTKTKKQKRNSDAPVLMKILGQKGRVRLSKMFDSESPNTWWWRRPRIYRIYRLWFKGRQIRRVKCCNWIYNKGGMTLELRVGDDFRLRATLQWSEGRRCWQMFVEALPYHRSTQCRDNQAASRRRPGIALLLCGADTPRMQPYLWDMELCEGLRVIYGQHRAVIPPLALSSAFSAQWH